MANQPIRPKDRFLVFGAPAIERDEIDEVVRTLESGWLGTGPRVRQFEQAVAKYKGVSPERVVAVSSCTAALHLSLLAADIGPGDEVITTPLTFCATVNAILYTGATPVLADVDPETLNLDPAQVREKLTERTRAILPVHFAGRPCDLEAYEGLAREHDLVLIEDSAHAFESTFDSRPTGTVGDFGCFSFYVGKNVVTGEGGMVIARDPDAAARVRRLSLHGLTASAWNRFSSSGYKHYEAVELGYKYNMMDIQAALGIHQVRRVEANWLRRHTIWKQYNAGLADLPLERPAPTDLPSSGGTRHALHLYTIQLRKEVGLTRDEVLAALTAQNIGTGVHYLSIPEHRLYQERLGWRPEDTPIATGIGRRTLSLPISARVETTDADDVIAALHRVLGR